MKFFRRSEIDKIDDFVTLVQSRNPEVQRYENFSLETMKAVGLVSGGIFNTIESKMDITISSQERFQIITDSLAFVICSIESALHVTCGTTISIGQEAHDYCLAVLLDAVDRAPNTKQRQGLEKSFSDAAREMKAAYLEFKAQAMVAGSDGGATTGTAALRLLERVPEHIHPPMDVGLLHITMHVVLGLTHRLVEETASEYCLEFER